MSSTKIYASNKAVGKVQDGVFLKKVSGSRHFLRVPPAIAFDIASLRQAEAAGAHSVQVDDVDTHKVYTAPLARIWDDGFYVDRGYGKQVALPLAAWTVQM